MTYALIALALLVALNVRATRRILGSDEFGYRKRLFIIGVWVIPVFGALNFVGREARATARAPGGQAPEAGFSREPAPAELNWPGAAPFALHDHMAAPHGLPLLDWTALGLWASGLEDPARVAAAVALGRRAWLLHMREVLGPDFHLHETDDAWVLSSLEYGTARATARYIATTRQRIRRVHGRLAHFPEREKSILLVLDEEDLYYDYVAGYYPEGGEFAFSSGMFINAGCGHFVVQRGELAAIEPVIAHEMSHAAVAHLRLPTWLDEGLAVNTEHRLTGTPRSGEDPRHLRRQHRGFWGSEEVRQFWSGEAFFRPDEGNRLAYDLARLMVQQMAADWPRFEDFALAARRDDAGAAAAKEHLGVDLGSYVCTLLEREHSPDWSPNPVPAGRVN